MRKIGACVAFGALAAIFFTSQPAAAFGLRIGPFHIGIPFPWHHRHLYMRASPGDLGRRETSHGATTALLYPNLALSAIFQNIFWPANSSPWPFGYRDIFSTAFARAPAGPDRRLCQQSDNANAIVGHIGEEIAPTADQEPLLQKLGGAIGAASGYLAKSCPTEIPAQPVARLQLMKSQIEELTMAINIVRPPLQDFQQSLNDEQKARFAAMIEAPSAAEKPDRTNIASACVGSSTAIDWSIDRIDRSVQPTDAQRNALDGMKQAFGQAESDLAAHCPTSMPPTALGRLDMIEARLDSTWRAVLSIQVALAGFETKLSDAQRDRFNAVNFAAR